MKILLFILLLLFFPHSNGWSDNFADENINDWWIYSGSWSASGGYLHNIASGIIQYNISNVSHMRVDFSIGSYGGGSNYINMMASDFASLRGGQIVYSSFYPLGSMNFVTMGGFVSSKNYTWDVTFYPEYNSYHMRMLNKTNQSVDTSISNNDQTVSYVFSSKNQISFQVGSLPSLKIYYVEASPPPTPTPTPTPSVTCEPSSPYCEPAPVHNQTQYQVDFSSCGWLDISCMLDSFSNYIWKIIMNIYDFLYDLLYSLLSIPINLANSIISGFSLIFNDIYGVITDIAGLMGNVYNFINFTAKLLYDLAWITIIMTGFGLVVTFRIWSLVYAGAGAK